MNSWRKEASLGMGIRLCMLIVAEYLFLICEDPIMTHIESIFLCSINLMEKRGDQENQFLDMEVSKMPFIV
jgi:hypothetical protein